MLLRGWMKSPLVGSDYEGQTKLQEWSGGGNMRGGVDLIRLGRIPGLKRETWGHPHLFEIPGPQERGTGGTRRGLEALSRPGHPAEVRSNRRSLHFALLRSG